jgi:hypothetical protein
METANYEELKEEIARQRERLEWMQKACAMNGACFAIPPVKVECGVILPNGARCQLPNHHAGEHGGVRA